MSVLSRPHLRHAPTTTQQTAQIPLPRTAPVPSPAGREPSPAARQAREDHDAKRRRTALAAGGLVAVLGVAGMATYLVLDDPASTSGTTSTTVDVPAVDSAELQRDANTARRAQDARQADAVRGTRHQITE